MTKALHFAIAWVGTCAALSAGGCSLVVDDAPYSCAANRLCPDGRSLCVGDASNASCQPLIDDAIGCPETFPSNLGELSDVEIYPIGLIARRATPADPSDYGVPTTQAIKLAIDRINDAATQTRKFVAVVCEEAGKTKEEVADSERRYLGPRVDHLVKRLRVPAILGGSTSGATRRLNEKYLMGHDTLLISPTATDDTLRDGAFLRSGGREQLFWRTVPPDSRQVAAMKRVLQLVYSTLMEGQGSGAMMTVAATAFDPDNTASQNLYNLFTQEGDTFVAKPEYDTADADSKAKAVDTIVKSKPRIIMPFGTDEFVKYVLPDGTNQSMLIDIESRWDRQTPRPWYIMTEGNRTSYKEVFEAEKARNQDWKLETRLIGTAQGPRNASYYMPFVNDYKRANADSLPGNLAEFGYDAAYLLAYAVAKAEGEQDWPRGPALARAVAELSCTSSPRPDNEQPVAASLSYGGRLGFLNDDPAGCFNFQGASGNVDYASEGEQRRGVEELDDASSAVALWCLGDLESDADQTVNLKAYYDQVTGTIRTGPSGMSMEVALSLSDPNWCQLSLMTQ